MSSSQYGAIVNSSLSLKIGPFQYTQTRIVLVSSIDNYAKKIELSPSENLIKKYSEFEKMKNRPEHKIIKKQFIKLRDSIEEMARIERDSFNNIDDYVNSKIYVMSDANMDMVEFLNKIGKKGWETTGQVPNSGGITMMRRRS